MRHHGVAAAHVESGMMARQRPGFNRGRPRAGIISTVLLYIPRNHVPVLYSMSRFDGLIAAHIPHLRRYARALTGDGTRADDLVQDTLERAWIKFHLWQPGNELRPWLFSIMHNVFVNQVRASARRSPSTIPADDEFAGEVRANQSDLLEVRDVAACLQQLPFDQREVLLLVSLEDLTYAQASTVLNVPVGTVMSRLARARTRLRALLSGASGPTGLKVIK